MTIRSFAKPALAPRFVTYGEGITKHTAGLAAKAFPTLTKQRAASEWLRIAGLDESTKFPGVPGGRDFLAEAIAKKMAVLPPGELLSEALFKVPANSQVAVLLNEGTVSGSLVPPRVEGHVRFSVSSPELREFHVDRIEAIAVPMPVAKSAAAGSEAPASGR